METKRYTNVHIASGFSTKSTFKKPVTLEYAREYGENEAKERKYLKYLGVLNVDITNAQLKKILKENQLGGH